MWQEVVACIGIVMACTVMAYVVMAYVVLAYAVLAHKVMAHVGMSSEALGEGPIQCGKKSWPV